MKLNLALLATLAFPLPAAYQNLIATEDGTRVFFTAPTSITRSAEFLARASSLQTLTDPFEDADGSGNLVASSTYRTRSCAISGSTCYLQPDCYSGFGIVGNGTFWSLSGTTAFIRFNRKGDVVWLNPTASCPPGLGYPPTPAFAGGLYDVASRQLLTSLGGTKLATQRVGRRALTDDRRALVFAGPQLNWLDRTGLRLIPTNTVAHEAVTDASGANIVYSEAEGGRLHWIANGQDQPLGFSGTMPALSTDGATLVFLDSAHFAQAYVRQSATTRPLSQDALETFTLGGNFVFATNTKGQIIRIDLTSAQQVTWLEASPEIDSFAALAGIACPYVCYGPQEPNYQLAPGMIVVLKGKNLNRPNLAATLAGVQLPITPLSDTAAFFQLPQATPIGLQYPGKELTVRDNSAPIAFTTTVSIATVAPFCLAAVHQDFATPVTPDNPAIAGEIIHEFVTGVRSPEPIPDGSPNPTDHLVPLSLPFGLIDPAVADVLFFGLAPGQIGLDQLDLRILIPSYSGCRAL